MRVLPLLVLLLGCSLGDCDGDGFTPPEDCDEHNAAINPDATDMVGDSTDQNCDGIDGYDGDGDGVAAEWSGGLDCDDDEPQTYTGATDRPYDGVDQDCDGADLTDVDDDGFVGMAAGGDDCDDQDPAVFPGAWERPCDGVDNDCDGGDQTDVDEDGHDCSGQGGDDCDDQDATIHGDAVEIPCDGVDQDCDGLDGQASAEVRDNGVDDDCDALVDERIVCADGSGDYTSIQQAVDNSDDGAHLQLCPGRYAERVTIHDMALTLGGAGEDPEQVLIDGQEEAAGFDMARATLTLRWLSITGAHTPLVSIGDDSEVTLQEVAFRPLAGAGSAISVSGAQTDVTVERCWFGDTGNAYIVYGSDPGDLSFEHNVIVGDTSSSQRLHLYGSSTVRENLFIGLDDIIIDADECEYVSLAFNTFVASDSFRQKISWEQQQDMPYVAVYANIYADLVPASYTLMELAVAAVAACSWHDMRTFYPALLEENVVWQVDGLPFSLACHFLDENVVYSTMYSGRFAGQNLLTDPLFYEDAGGMGSWASGLVGHGAFANSDWSGEVPWTMP